MSLDDLSKETDFKFIGRLQEAKARAEDFERHARAQAGLETGDGNNHHALLDAATQAKPSDHKKQARSDKNGALWLDLIQRQIAELQTAIDDAEQGFASQYGEDWRELFALKILDPDLMPQREDGESLEDYRTRVEQALMDELLNQDGSIKDEYKDHPEYGELAQWAQWKYDEQQGQALKSTLSDPSLSDEAREQAVDDFIDGATYQRLNQEAAASALISDQLLGAKEELKDNSAAVASKLTEDVFQP